MYFLHLWSVTPTGVARLCLNVSSAVCVTSVCLCAISVFEPKILSASPATLNAMSLLFMGLQVLTMYICNDVTVQYGMWRTSFFCFLASVFLTLLSISKRRTNPVYLDLAYYGFQFSIWLQCLGSIYYTLNYTEKRRKNRVSKPLLRS